MEPGTLPFTAVEKELVSTLKFPTDDISVDMDRRKNLRNKLWRATRLGNIEHNKVKLYFEDDEGMKMVHTTIWATGERNIVLKRGVTIPINRIHDVVIL